MDDKRKANIKWNLNTNYDGTTAIETVQAAVLMDIRDELQKLNRLLHCSNFTDIPHILRTIRRNTAKKPRRRKKS